MKTMFVFLMFVSILVIGCNTAPKTNEAAVADTVATEVPDAEALALDSAKVDIDKSVEELDKLVNDLN